MPETYRFTFRGGHEEIIPNVESIEIAAEIAKTRYPDGELTHSMVKKIDSRVNVPWNVPKKITTWNTVPLPK